MNKYLSILIQQKWLLVVFSIIIASQFTKLLEKGELTQDLFYAKSHKALADLYSSGLDLESIDLKYSDSETEFELAKKNLDSRIKI